MRVLHAIQTINPSTGGPVEGIKQLAAFQHERGYKVEAVTLDDPSAPFVHNAPIPVHALGPGRTSYGFNGRFVPWLRQHRHDYDCVIVNGIWGFNAYGTWLALRNTSTPYVVFTHGMLDPWFKFRYPLKHLKKWLYYPWALYPVLRDADAVLFTCEQERLLARQSFWLYDCNEVVVRYGTSGIPDPEKDYTTGFLEKHPDLANKRRFLFLGRVHPKKGPDLLIQAVGALQRKKLWDPASMRLVMAGPAEGDYATHLNELAEKEGITSSIYWTGMITGDEKWGAIQSAETFILPSHQENFGIAVTEALSARVPVLICHPVNISPEIKEDGAGLVDEDTLEGCERLLTDWFALPQAKKDAMRVQARETFVKRYTARDSAEHLAREIQLIILARSLDAGPQIDIRLA